MKARCIKYIGDNFYIFNGFYDILNYSSESKNITIRNDYNVCKTENREFLKNNFELIPENETEEKVLYYENKENGKCVGHASSLNITDKNTVIDYINYLESTNIERCTNEELLEELNKRLNKKLNE